MKTILSAIFLIFCALSGTADASVVLKISRAQTRDVVHLAFSFDETPEFTSYSSDRRIDLEFFKTTCPPSVALGEPDGDIVKILPRPTKDRYILSLFFRYRPQHHTLTKNADGKLVLEVLLGNEHSKSNQNLADRLKGVSIPKNTIDDPDNPYLTSPYAKDWMSFFSQYESPVKIEVPVKFSSPPFPLISLLPPGEKDNLRLLTPQMIELAGQNDWHGLADILLASLKNTTDVASKKMLALTYGEVLSRNGNFADAYRQLYLMQNQYRDELFGTYAKYLLNHLRAAYESPYLADIEYRLLEPSLTNSLPIAPYFLVSRMETALATGNMARLKQLLDKDDVPMPEQVAEIVRIRQADYWNAVHEPDKAGEAYQLQTNTRVLQTLPSSLCTSCNLLYEQKQFAKAGACYQQLSALVADENQQSLINYRKNMAKLKEMDGNLLIDEFSLIEKDSPHTEAGFRAALKRNDLLFLQDKAWGPRAIENYGAIAQESITRPIREEALFKQALVHAVVGQPSRAVQLLQQFLREFLTGDVRISAQALLIHLLPGEIKRLVDTHEYMQPLVLAKQNSMFFQNKWIDSTLLVNIAEAYSRIGIYDEAQKLYLYLIGIMPPSQQEAFYLPMIEATLAHGNFSLADDYAARYTHVYPNGRYGVDVLVLRLKALVADERFDDALRLLPNPLPQSKAICQLALPLYFRLDDYKNCLTAARKLIVMKSPLSQREQFMFAESLYSTGAFEDAERAYMAVTGECAFYEQSLYRQAQLARQKGDEKKALSFFQKTVETEKNSIWKQYAERELQFASDASQL